jgi:hypothetical protein
LVREYDYKTNERVMNDQLHKAHVSHIQSLHIIENFITLFFTLPRKSIFHLRQKKWSLFELPKPSLFDLRDGEPMSMFLNDSTGISQTRWTRLYKDDVNNDMTITASTSLYDASGTFKGIVGIDVSLNHLLMEIFCQAQIDK